MNNLDKKRLLQEYQIKQIIVKEYLDIERIFELEKNSFGQRSEKMRNTSFELINWSSSYLDFFPYESVLNQLCSPIIYKEKKETSIKNCYLNSQLIFSCNNMREAWGSLFIEYGHSYKKSLLFIEDDNGNMILSQLKIAYFKNNLYEKVVTYFNDEDNDEKSLCIYTFQYGLEKQIINITRYGFFEELSKIVPITDFHFLYYENRVRIIAKKELGIEEQIYSGKILQNRNEES